MRVNARRVCLALGLLGTLGALGACQKSVANRSLIFFTGTTVGIEASVNPSDTTGPARVVIGYKRAEGVLNPVYEPDGVESAATRTTTTTWGADGSTNSVSVLATKDSGGTYKPPPAAGSPAPAPAPAGGSGAAGAPAAPGNAPPPAPTPPTTAAAAAAATVMTTVEPLPGPGGAYPATRRYRDDAYSVIAKFSGEGASNVSNQADAKMSVAQWFATGEAAVILARQPGIAGAVTGSPEIAKATVQARVQLPPDDPVGRSQARSVIQAIANGLAGMAQSNAEAAKHLAAAEAVVNRVRPRVYVQYTLDPGAANPPLLITKVQPVAAGVVGYVGYLQGDDASLTMLEQELKKARFDFEDRVAGKARVTVVKDDDQWKALDGELRRGRLVAENQNNAICADASVVSAIEFYIRTLTGGK